MSSFRILKIKFFCKFEMKLFLVIMLSKFNRLTHLCCEGEKEKTDICVFFGSKKKLSSKNLFFRLRSINKESNDEISFYLMDNKNILLYLKYLIKNGWPEGQKSTFYNTECLLVCHDYNFVLQLVLFIAFQ